MKGACLGLCSLTGAYEAVGAMLVAGPEKVGLEPGHPQEAGSPCRKPLANSSRGEGG